MNGDGLPDLIVANLDDNTVSVLLNTTAPGATTLNFAAQQTFATGNIPVSVVAADVNGDGRPDLLVANQVSNTVSVLLNTPAVLGSHPATGTIEAAPVVLTFVLADPNPTNAATVHFTITFSEAVSGVAAGNFVLTGTGTAGAVIGTPTTSDGGITWTVPVTTGVTGTLGLHLYSRSGILDGFDNQLYDSTSDDGTTFNPIVGPFYTFSASSSTSTSIGSSLNPLTYGQSVTFTATVTNTSSSGGVPTGSVEFFDASTSLGTGSPLDGTGTTATSTFTTTTLAAGVHRIYVVYTATGIFVDSTSAFLTQTVNQAPLNVTAVDKTKVYGAADPTLTYTVTGLQNNDPTSVVTGVSLSTATGAAATAGTHTITATGGEATNYAITDANGTLTVSQAALTVTADDKAKVYGGADPALTYTLGTLFYNDPTSVVTGVSLSTATGAVATAGTHTITATGGEATNYAITDANGTLTVSQAASTVTADDKAKVYGAADPHSPTRPAALSSTLTPTR